MKKKIQLSIIIMAIMIIPLIFINFVQISNINNLDLANNVNLEEDQSDLMNGIQTASAAIGFPDFIDTNFFDYSGVPVTAMSIYDFAEGPECTEVITGTSNGYCYLHAGTQSPFSGGSWTDKEPLALTGAYDVVGGYAIHINGTEGTTTDIYMIGADGGQVYYENLATSSRDNYVI
ncbi:MAG: hypothetical protein GF364_08540 [Candidatus Lokiarchaeota archaeon]|nr:hypothetical protein [Candidatus Lokiarchaeota archaeon]